MVASIRRLYEAEIPKGGAGLVYLGYSGVLVRVGECALLFDPGDLLPKRALRELRRLDLLLFTHGHYDHFDERAAVAMYEAAKPKVVCEESVYRRLRGKVPEEDLIRAKPGESVAVGGASVEAVAGRHVGPIVLYLVEVGGVRVFHGGDSGYVPLRPRRADLAIVPTGDPSPTASPDDALRMVLDLGPSAVVPVHGSEQQRRELERKLRELRPGVEVLVLGEGESAVVELG